MSPGNHKRARKHISNRKKAAPKTTLSCKLNYPKSAKIPRLSKAFRFFTGNYFGGVRKGKRGRGAAGKIPVFGLLKRGGKVYAVIIPNARTETLLPIIESKIKPDSIVYTDSFKAYDVLDVSDFHHVRINHSQLFAEDRNHINGIENFWNQAKRHLRRYNGIPKHHFHLYLKECEWRFNYRPTANLLKVLRQWASM